MEKTADLAMVKKTIISPVFCSILFKKKCQIRMSPQKNQDTKDALYKEMTSSIFSTVCLMELLDSVQQDEGEQRTAEEHEALSDAFSTVTQIPLTT